MNKTHSLRYIENTFLAEKIDFDYIKTTISNLLGRIVQDQINIVPPEKQVKLYSNKKEKIDYSIYSGSGGNIYAFWRLHLLQKSIGNELEKAASLKLLTSYWKSNYDLIRKLKKTNVPSFFQGPVGIYTMGCLLARESNCEKDFESNLKKILSFKEEAMKIDTEYELLYGTTGYLYSLLLIKSECQSLFKFNLDEEITEIFLYLYNCGIVEKKKNKAMCLLYPWSRNYENNPKIYVGAVHGIFGALYVLMKSTLLVPELANKCKEYDSIIKEIKSSIKYLISLQFPDGNFPSSLGSETNKLIHFCHGAPGSIYTLSLAYQIFQEEEILKAALAAGEIIWKKGILKKGNPVCHGIVGNAIVLNELFRLTKDDLWKRRSLCLTLATFDKDIQLICSQTDDQQRFVKGLPDTPYSLMEGQAGLIAFYSDVLNDKIVFPGFEILV